MTKERRVAALAFVGLALCVGAVHVLRHPKPPADSVLPALAAPEPVEPTPNAGLPVGEAPAPKPKYTNEELHDMLQRQQKEMGITAVGAEAQPEEEQGGGFMQPGAPGDKENVQAHLRQLAQMRKVIQGNKPRNIAIDGQTAPVLNTGPRGGPLEAQEEKPLAPAIESNAVTSHGDGSWSGSFGGPESGESLVRDSKSWRGLWRSLSKEPLPEVDFSKQMVAMINLGVRPTGGYQARIVDAAVKDEALVIRYKESPPAPGVTPPQERTAPFALRVVPKTDKPVRFEKLKE